MGAQPSVYERYQRDPTFHALVDAMYAQIAAAQVTPTEVREAAMMAQILWEEKNVRPVLMREVAVMRER